jgi:uncharacterized membrane protein YcgQ (UPF0703/DUF1980 family)
MVYSPRNENIAQYKPYVYMTHITSLILILVHYVRRTAPEQQMSVINLLSSSSSIILLFVFLSFRAQSSKIEQFL